MKALQAHVRLLENTPPDRIKTHERYVEEFGSGKPREISDDLTERFREMKAKGWSQKKMKVELRIAFATLRKLMEAEDLG
jgi:uncharacterized protein (UPF0335 family)